MRSDDLRQVAVSRGLSLFQTVTHRDWSRLVVVNKGGQHFLVGPCGTIQAPAKATGPRLAICMRGQIFRISTSLRPPLISLRLPDRYPTSTSLVQFSR
jgi:hypothetical protein